MNIYNLGTIHASMMVKVADEGPWIDRGTGQPLKERYVLPPTSTPEDGMLGKSTPDSDGAGGTTPTEDTIPKDMVDPNVSPLEGGSTGEPAVVENIPEQRGPAADGLEPAPAPAAPAKPAPKAADPAKEVTATGWREMLDRLRTNAGTYMQGFSGTDAAVGAGSALLTALLTGRVRNSGLRLLYALLAGGGGLMASRVGRDLYETRGQDMALKDRLFRQPTTNA